MSAPLPTRLDMPQVLNRVFDEDNGLLRTSSIATIANADIDVALDSLEDSVAIKSTTGVELKINPDGSINTITTVDVTLDASTDNVAISDGTDTLAINADGSINVNVTAAAVIVSSKYTEVLGVVSGITTLIGSYTAVANDFLEKVQFSGTNTAEYELVINGITQDKKRTYFGNGLNDTFDFDSGISITLGQVVQVYVIHNRPYTGDFNARIQTRKN